LFASTKSAVLAGFSSDLQNRAFQPLAAKVALWVEFARKTPQIDVYAF
jgi:hypothetical protein